MVTTEESQEAVAEVEELAFPRVGARAILCNLAKFPKFNGQNVELAAWNEEKGRWKCLLANGGDVLVYPTNLEPAEMPSKTVQHLESCLKEGKLFEVWNSLRGKATAPQTLRDALEAKLASGPYSEHMDGRLKLVNLEDRGAGYQAAKAIKQGDVLLFEKSLCHGRIQVDHNADGAPNMMCGDGNGPYKEMARTLRQNFDETFLNENVYPIKVAVLGGDPRDGLVKILDNCTFECCKEPGRICFFAAASRFNHSCCPNAYADADRDYVVIRALRDIDAGEEVCVSYVPVSEGLQARKKKLEAYHFDCKCVRCVAEEKHDPQMHVPCQCGKFEFTMIHDTRLWQTCPECYTQFCREEAEHHLSKIAEANKMVYGALMSGEDTQGPLRKLAAMESKCRPGAKDGIPPMCTEALLLYSNLANCNYFNAMHNKEAALGNGALEAFHKYKRMSIDKFEERHGSWTNQRDVDYFQLLHQVMQAKGLSEENRLYYSQKLTAACNLCFGQNEIPKTLTTFPGRQV